jgi:ABC-2 type transport system ATP-binding protein
MHIEITDLSRYFGSTHAVDDVTFSFNSGDIFGLVGPNGAGKTTTMRILATLDEPTTGDAFLDGVSVVQEPERVRGQIGFMPDSLPTHRDVSVHDYLDFFARAYGLRQRQRMEAIARAEDFTNLAGLRHKMLRALSKGMKQRVSLARALVHDPALLILDEPAAGLDPRARIELRELLKALAEKGKAILISSHILTELSQMCVGAAIMERGRLVKAGRLEDLYRLHESADGKNLRVVAIRVAGDSQKLRRMLAEMPGVAAVTPVGDFIHARVQGDEKACGELLAELLKRGLQILEFKQVNVGLEDLFMSVTKGDVQ